MHEQHGNNETAQRQYRLGTLLWALTPHTHPRACKLTAHNQRDKVKKLRRTFVWWIFFSFFFCLEGKEGKVRCLCACAINKYAAHSEMVCYARDVSGISFKPFNVFGLQFSVAHKTIIFGLISKSDRHLFSLDACLEFVCVYVLPSCVASPTKPTKQSAKQPSRSMPSFSSLCIPCALRCWLVPLLLFTIFRCVLHSNFGLRTALDMIFVSFTFK